MISIAFPPIPMVISFYFTVIPFYFMVIPFVDKISRVLCGIPKETSFYFTIIPFTTMVVTHSMESEGFSIPFLVHPERVTSATGATS
jgi:hypothetical protein